MNILINWLLNALTIMLTTYFLSGIHIDSFLTALLIALILGILNVFIRPILILLTLPLTIISLGLFLFVINAVLVLLASSLVPGFEVDGFGWAILFSMILALLNLLISSVFRK